MKEWDQQKHSPCHHNAQKSSRYSNLAGGLDSFEYAKIHDDPGHHEKAEEFPANPTSFTNAVRSLQEPVTGGGKWKKKLL